MGQFLDNFWSVSSDLWGRFWRKFGQFLEKIFLAVFGEIRAVFNFGLVLEDICAVFEELWGSLGKTFGQF